MERSVAFVACCLSRRESFLVQPAYHVYLMYAVNTMYM